MRFTVIWYAGAEQDLARIWLAAIEKRAVTAAANAIDEALRMDANSKGIETRGWRLLYIPPLAVVFKVDEANRQVHVRHVWRDTLSN